MSKHPWVDGSLAVVLALVVGSECRLPVSRHFRKSGRPSGQRWVVQMSRKEPGTGATRMCDTMKRETQVSFHCRWIARSSSRTGRLKRQPDGINLSVVRSGGEFAAGSRQCDQEVTVSADAPLIDRLSVSLRTRERAASEGAALNGAVSTISLRSIRLRLNYSLRAPHSTSNGNLSLSEGASAGKYSADGIEYTGSSQLSVSRRVVGFTGLTRSANST